MGTAVGKLVWHAPVALLGVMSLSTVAAAEDMSRYRKNFYALSRVQRLPYLVDIAECKGALEAMGGNKGSLFGRDELSNDVMLAYFELPSLESPIWSGTATPEQTNSAVSAGATKAAQAKTEAEKRALVNRCKLIEANYKAMVTDNFDAVRDQ